MPREIDSCTLKGCFSKGQISKFLFQILEFVFRLFNCHEAVLFFFWMSILPYFYLSRYHIFWVFSLLLSPFRNLYRIYLWDLKSCLFIKVTNLEERGRVKCYQYWPSEGGEAYGDIQVTLMQTVELSDFTIRTLCLKKANSRTERTVNQYHYTIWPDHGVPTCATSVLTFVRKASGVNPPDSGPMVSYRQIL